jgi:hypothetical protein
MEKTRNMIRKTTEDWFSLFAKNYEWALGILGDRTIDTAVDTFGVDSSTIRAMPTGNDAHPPSGIFSDWARDQDSNLGIQSGGSGYSLSQDQTAVEVRERLAKDFVKWHEELAESLRVHWANRMKKVPATTRTNTKNQPYLRKQYKELTVAHKYKLVDLYVRSLRLRVPENSAAHQAVLANANIPLDKKSIAVINAFLGKKKTKTTMGDIKSDKQYDEYQNYAKDICKQIGAPNGVPASKLVFDTFAWHHPDAQVLYTE